VAVFVLHPTCTHILTLFFLQAATSGYPIPVYVADPTTIVKILRKNFSAKAKKRILDFPPSMFEVELADGTVAYWPTSRASLLAPVLLKNFDALKKQLENARLNPLRDDATHAASNNISRAAARFAARQADPAARVAALVELDEQIAYDKANFPTSLLVPVVEDIAGKSSLKGDIEAVCSRRYLELTSDAALQTSSCAVCFETHLQSTMEHVDCTDLDDAKELFRPLKEFGTWPSQAVPDFQFSEAFAGLNGAHSFASSS
jgi:hypothetical protein